MSKVGKLFDNASKPKKSLKRQPSNRVAPSLPGSPDGGSGGVSYPGSRAMM